MAAVLERGWHGLGVLDSYLGVSGLVDDSSNVILEYHSIGGGLFGDIPPATFEQHLQYLTGRYDVVDLPDVVTSTADSKKVALTFDDGLADFYHNALPIVREFSVPVTVFAIADSLSEDGFAHDREYDYEYMSHEQVLELVDEELVTVGNHTRSHPDLTTLSARDDVAEEILGGQRVLERELGISIDRFAYPYNAVDERSVEVVADSHEFAVTDGGWHEFITAPVDPYRLPRTNGALDLEQLAWMTSDLSTWVGATTLALLERIGLDHYVP